MHANWKITEGTAVTNRYDRFTRFAELMLHTHEDESWIQVSGWYQTGSRMFSVALSATDAERLRDALTQALEERRQREAIDDEAIDRFAEEGAQAAIDAWVAPYPDADGVWSFLTANLDRSEWPAGVPKEMPEQFAEDYRRHLAAKLGVPQ